MRVERPKASGSRQWVLRPGQNLSLPQGIKTAPRVEVVDPKTATSWTSGRLVFSETPLEDAVAEVNRYSRNKVILDVEGLVRAPSTPPKPRTRTRRRILQGDASSDAPTLVVKGWEPSARRVAVRSTNAVHQLDGFGSARQDC